MFEIANATNRLLAEHFGIKAEQCTCPEEKLIVRSFTGRVLDQMREGFLETQCITCGKYHRYDLGDCFTLRNRREIHPN